MKRKTGSPDLTDLLRRLCANRGEGGTSKLLADLASFPAFPASKFDMPTATKTPAKKSASTKATKPAAKKSAARKAPAKKPLLRPNLLARFRTHPR